MSDHPESLPVHHDPGQDDPALVEIALHHRGPLPHPATLAAYEEALPGTGQIILQMAVDEQRHRHVQEDRQNKTEAARPKCGMTATLVVAGLGFALAGYALFLGYPWAGATIGGIDLIGLASVFIYGPKNDPTPPPDGEDDEE